MTTREVVIKKSWYEVGVGSVDANVEWESEPTAEGAIVRLDRTNDGSLYLTFTDAEEFDGAYVSVAVTPADLSRLWAVIEGGDW